MTYFSVVSCYVLGVDTTTTTTTTPTPTTIPPPATDTGLSCRNNNFN